jgi:alkylhydroperoxidase/carboxymuconolactone decarboxylase family protein YurZ
MSQKPAVGASFQAFVTQAPGFSSVWMAAVDGLGKACLLEPKTKALCYLAVLASARLTSGIAFHASLARAAGATKDEVVGAILIGLPAVGNAVIEALPAALAVFEDTGG